MARQGDARRALSAQSAFRILCAHRRGPNGVSRWTAMVEERLRREMIDLDPREPWYAGRPVLVTRNDPEVGLYNGDAGVIVRRSPEVLRASFLQAGEVRDYSLSRLPAVETVFAMTIHKSQGSQFDQVAVLLPGEDSRILTRELLYTALTRARERLIIVGSEASIRAAVRRPISRASGLGRRLWGEPEISG